MLYLSWFGTMYVIFCFPELHRYSSAIFSSVVLRGRVSGQVCEALDGTV